MNLSTVNLPIYSRLARELEERSQRGLLKTEQVLLGAQSGLVSLAERGQPVLNFCSNNYLGLANHPSVVSQARRVLDQAGFGMASVRFITGTHRLHRLLEDRLSAFLGMEATMLFASCFDANGGLLASLVEEGDAIVSARLNHASIIDGVRLAKCRRFTYSEEDPADFARALAEAAGQSIIAITDGVFSMEGTLAPLDRLVPLAREHGALLAVDDSHATGVIGAGGRGTSERFGVIPDIITGTLGKALGGGTGGFIAGKRVLIDWLRNTSRPYLFSNSLAPVMVAGALAALDIVMSDEGAELRGRLLENTLRFRAAMRELGLQLFDSEHPIVPIMIGDASAVARLASRLLEAGIYVVGFSHPVVPLGAARIRVQLSALHTEAQIDQLSDALQRVAQSEGLLEGKRAPLAHRAPQRATMRAWAYSQEPDQAGVHLRETEIPIPQPQNGELLLKVRKVSVCGTDEDLFRGKFKHVKDGIIPGHELFGEVVEIGGNVRGFHPGQHIVAESHYRLPGFETDGIIGLWGPTLENGSQLTPINGGYAEYVTIPTYCAHPVPRLLDASGFYPSLLEGVGNDCLIAKYLLDHGLLEHVAILGCGPHGLFTQLFARHFQVRHLAAFDIEPTRLERAGSFGADLCINPRNGDALEQSRKFTQGRGFDCVVDTAGGKPEVLDLCFELVRDGGTVVLFGLYGDTSLKFNGRTVNDIIFNLHAFDFQIHGKTVHIQGITGREGIWDYLINAVATSTALQQNIMSLVTPMGSLDRLGPDSASLNPSKIMKRAYVSFE